MGVKIDRAIYEMEVECDGKKTALGCMVAQHVSGETRDECNHKLLNAGWRIAGDRALCNLCVRREPGWNSIQVYIHKPSSRSRVEAYMRRHRHDGVKWDGEKLMFEGSSLEAAYAAAERYYEAMEKQGSSFDNVRARMRHRLGRNGHGWPLERVAIPPQDLRIEGK